MQMIGWVGHHGQRLPSFGRRPFHDLTQGGPLHSRYQLQLTRVPGVYWRAGQPEPPGGALFELLATDATSISSGLIQGTPPDLGLPRQPNLANGASCSVRKSRFGRQDVQRHRDALLSRRGARSHRGVLFGSRGRHIWPVGLPAVCGSPASRHRDALFSYREGLFSYRGVRSHRGVLFGSRGSHIWPVGLPAVLGSPASADKTSSATGMPCSAAEAASYIFSAIPRHPILALLPPPEPLSIPWGSHPVAESPC